MADTSANRSLRDWRASLLRLTGTEQAAAAWREGRYDFALRLGQALTARTPSGLPPVTGHVVYGVWLEWGLLYIGQSASAGRRLRDLPVGESHHLANTFPPEIWNRVVVVSWPLLAEAQNLPITPDLIGLGLEHRLQTRLRPLANSSRRKPTGGWRQVDWETSRSAGARVAPSLDALFERVLSLWEDAGRAVDESCSTEVCRVVFPPHLT
ncbi:hypothetical protein GCM10022247_20830 [Allokutzneria multivorans]|uniref:Uncharacterized protein n=1 Tax=Allokutzneria multivorans TaxID=1142134 RepID=A0ABP7RPA7_9PSEU